MHLSDHEKIYSSIFLTNKESIVEQMNENFGNAFIELLSEIELSFLSNWNKRFDKKNVVKYIEYLRPDSIYFKKGFYKNYESLITQNTIKIQDYSNSMIVKNKLDTNQLNINTDHVDFKKIKNAYVYSDGENLFYNFHPITKEVVFYKPVLKGAYNYFAPKNTLHFSKE